MLTTEEKNTIKEELEEVFDLKYRQLADCNRLIEKEDTKINSLTLEFAKSNTKLDILIGLLSVIAVPVISVAVKLLFGV